MMNAVVTAIIFIIFVPLTRVERLIDGAVRGSRRYSGSIL